jgi:hypothetical protein
MEFKFLILSPKNYDIKTLLHTIESENDNLVISNKFINDIKYKDTENNDRYYLLDNNTINASIKNNVVIYATSDVNIITGITVDDFYNSNVLAMSFNEFNNISTNFLSKHSDDFLIVWVDTKIHDNDTILKKEIKEVNYLLSKINDLNFKYIYFLDDDVNTISSVLNSYFTGDENIRTEILQEYC